MRIAFIADSRSEHTRNWVRHFVGVGDEVLLLSTFPGPGMPGVHIHILPGLFRIGNSMISSEHVGSSGPMAAILRLAMSPPLRRTVNTIWQQAKALDLPLQIRNARNVLEQFRPDLLHALRIQNEGYIGGWANCPPLVLSSWGSDFIYTANTFPVHNLLTHLTMKKADGYIADCRRDETLAHTYGLPPTVPTRRFPGSGGVDRDVFNPGSKDAPARARSILCMRGYSPLTRIDTLLGAFKILLARNPQRPADLILLMPRDLTPMIGQMCKEVGITPERVKIISSIQRLEVADLLKTVAITVSPMTSDGTPISMLEGMACGAFPVMSDLESIREWITHGQNGLLFDAASPEGLATCLEEGLDNVAMRQTAQGINARLIDERADYGKVMTQVRTFYQLVASSSPTHHDR